MLNQNAMNIYVKAQDLKKQKDEMQIKAFEKIIEEVWNRYDAENKGYIEGEQCHELIKYNLEKQGYGQYYKREVIDKVLE